MADNPTRVDLGGKTRNLRHRTLITKACQYLKEVVYAGTSNEPMVVRADYSRALDYIADLRSVIGSQTVAGAVLAAPAVGRPEVDNPLTRDDWWDVQSPIDVPEMENVFWEEFCIRVRKAIREMTDSQSALFSNNWHPSDPVRWENYFKAWEYDMSVLIGQIEPMDQPLTTPSEQPIFEPVQVDSFDTSGASNSSSHPNSR